ncbi:protein of unknown function [Magnetospirillum gryphiswaldense MSR-1 v2]|uniref:Uncharacterized protein n=1 Tax=Magnetospirillum gryphiswaldense (strain DSM 6361 / JCM 21280 / NBRC 15271 / MSR-1) TaxID=431944 RepID=V6F4M2_MAGGM|nr:protein of unknown function [Magnetospirillum gryphiswaldense MSR-1 v2]
MAASSVGLGARAEKAAAQDCARKSLLGVNKGATCRLAVQTQKRPPFARRPVIVGDGAPGRTRTSSPQIRSLVLYPIELRVLRRIRQKLPSSEGAEHTQTLGAAQACFFEIKSSLFCPFPRFVATIRLVGGWAFA